MILLDDSNGKRFSHGEYVILRALETVPDSVINYHVFSLRQQGYLQDDGSFDGVAPELFTVVAVHGIPTGEVVHSAYIDTSSLMNDDLLVVTLTDGVQTEVRNVEVGSGIIANDSTTVQVYGFLRDAHGLPMSGKVVTFTVMNSSGYFDNVPTTSLTAHTISDNDGKFLLNLNRNYKYVLTIHDLSYQKVVDLTTLPVTATVVEVDVGTGIGC